MLKKKCVNVTTFGTSCWRTKKSELKSVENFVAKTVLVESANQFSLEELCRTQYSLKYFFRSHIDHQTYGKTLRLIALNLSFRSVFFIFVVPAKQYAT